MAVEVESVSSAQAWRQVKHDLPEQLCEELVALAKEHKDTEVCGFILTDGTHVRIDNVDPQPGKGFVMDKEQMVKVIKGKTPIAATYHSHPSGRAWPSDTDSDHMSFLYKQGCPWRYLIVTTEGVFEFEHRDRS